MREDIYFYYTNDLHSDFKYWPQVANFLKDKKIKKTTKNKSSFIVDIGDHVDRVDPIAEAFMGKANIALMNDLNYDVVTLGNNEGITLAHEDLYQLYNRANFEVVCANLHNLNGENPDWLKPTTHIKSTQGVKIGIIGLTAPFKEFYNLLGWGIDSSYEVLQTHIAELKETTDIIVLLSHLGINEDRYIARYFSDIDVIIGGHTHHLLRTGEYVNETLLTAAGKHCAYVGEVILTWDHETQQLAKKEAYTTNITHLEQDTKTVKLLDYYNKRANELLSEPITTIDNRLKVDWYQATSVMKDFTNMLKEWTKADISMLNSGLLLDEFKAGIITYKDIHRICPHSINPCVVELNGAELLEVIRVSLTKELMEYQLKGFGFRGKVIGKMVFSGVHVLTSSYNDNQQYVQKVIYRGEPLVLNRKYKLATADAFTFGRLFPEIAKSTVKEYFLPELVRDVLVHTLQQNFS